MTLDKARRLATNYARGFKRAYFVLINEDLSNYQVIASGQTMPMGGPWLIYEAYDQTGNKMRDED